MTSASDPTNLSPVTDGDKPRGALAVVGGRVTEGERLVIDMAAAKLGVRRGHFIVAAAVARAKQVLEAA